MTAEIPADELLERFPSIPADELEEHLSLLNLVNFGGGCYTVYAELRDGSVHVDKELWGDTFRAAPRLTPLEARAIRLALEYVGPMIAADAHTPLSRVRKKLEETFGQFELARTPEPHVGDRRGRPRLEARARHARAEGSSRSSTRRRSTPSRRPGSSSRTPSSGELPNWYVHTWDRTSDGARSFRLDRMRSAKLTREQFEPRDGFEPTRLRDARTAKLLYDEDDRPLGDRARRAAARRRERAFASCPFGSDEWLESEILSLPRRGGPARAGRAAARGSPRARRRSRRSSASSGSASAPDGRRPYFGMKLMVPLLSRMPHSTSSTFAIC